MSSPMGAEPRRADEESTQGIQLGERVVPKGIPPSAEMPTAPYPLSSQVHRSASGDGGIGNSGRVADSARQFDEQRLDSYEREAGCYDYE